MQPDTLKRIDRLVQGGAQVGIWGCVLVALVAAAPTLPVATLSAFLGTIGGNLIANILDRASQKESITDDDLRHVLAMPQQLATLEQLFQQNILEAQDRKKISEDVKALAHQRNEILSKMDDNRRASHTENEAIYYKILDIERLILGPRSSDAELKQILDRYLHGIVRSRYTRMSTGGLLAEAASVADQIREPTLSDTFVEPFLVKAGSLRESRDETNRLLALVHDEDEETTYREEARRRLLGLTSATWQKIWKGKQAEPSSKVLDEYPALVILGDPGSGKSTLARWLLLRQADRCKASNSQIPLMVAVGDFANACKACKDRGESVVPFEAFLIAHTDSLERGMGEVVVNALANGGVGVLLFLDGLDEVPRDLRRLAVERIQEFINAHVDEHKASRVVVCSRFFGYEEAPLTAPIVQLVLAPFNDEQIRNFATKWYQWAEKYHHRDQSSLEIAKDDSERLLSAVFSQFGITNLARNPLMLSMIAVVVRQGKILPKRRVELYDLTLKQLMTQWQFLRAETQSKFEIDYREACQLWSPIARWMHEEGTGAVHEEELRKKLEKGLKELERDESATDWLTVRGDKCCLLQERGNHIFGFLHQTFQEYLAARDVCVEGRFVPEIDRYIEDPRWHEVLRLTCGYLGIVADPPQKANVSTLIQRILDHGSPYEHLLHRDLMLAASCTADEVRPKKEVERTVLNRLLVLCTSNEDSTIILKAMGMVVANAHVDLDASVLEKYESAIAVHPHWRVRYLFLKWIAQRAVNSLEPYLSRLSVDDDADVQCLAHVLQWCQTQEVTYLRNLPKPVMPETKRDAATFLALRKGHFEATLTQLSPGDMIGLAELLKGTESFKDAVPNLVKLLQSENDETRLQAAQLLTGTEAFQKAIPIILNLLQSEDERINLQAANLLEVTGAFQEAVPVLMKLLQSDNEQTRLWAVQSLAGTEAFQEAVPVLMKLLQSDNEQTRLWAAQWLAGTGAFQEAVPVLMKLLQSDNERTRLWAAQSLKRTEVFQDAIPVLVNSLQSQDEETRIQAADLLKGTETFQEAIPILVNGLQSKDEEIRWWVADLLKEAEAFQEVIPVLVNLLLNENEETRLQAAELLGETGAFQEAIPVLVNLLLSENEETRFQAVELLEETEMTLLVVSALGRSLRQNQIELSDLRDVTPDHPLYKVALLYAEYIAKSQSTN